MYKKIYHFFYFTPLTKKDARIGFNVTKGIALDLSVIILRTVKITNYVTRKVYVKTYIAGICIASNRQIWRFLIYKITM